MPIKLLCDWALFIGKNPSLDWERFWRYTDEFGMLRFAQSMTRLSGVFVWRGVRGDEGRKDNC